MKKIHRKKLTLTSTTVRALLADDMLAANAGMRDVSVGTCGGCRPTYNPTEKFSCVGACA
ncbi:MAG TPA: hypothetical protein VGD37_05465 [Kofleriaceae bacterium]|jgi:hypothetical protein